MSDTYLHLIPSDPDYRPTEDAAEAGVRLLKGFFPRADGVKVLAEKGVVFFDAGENTESVACPACAADLMDWWGDAMVRAHASAFSDLSVVTPCCSKRTSLNDLVYVWPAAFGCFALEVSNPGESSIAEAQRTAIEQVLGCSAKTVWQRL
jgi:hypothetical protein